MLHVLVSATYFFRGFAQRFLTSSKVEGVLALVHNLSATQVLLKVLLDLLVVVALSEDLVVVSAGEHQHLLRKH